MKNVMVLRVTGKIRDHLAEGGQVFMVHDAGIYGVGWSVPPLHFGRPGSRERIIAAWKRRVAARGGEDDT